MLIKPTRSPLIVPTRDSLVAPGGLPWDAVQRVGAAPPFSPADVAGQEAWYRGDTTVDVSGVVQTWTDKSGNARNITQGTAAARPTPATRAGQRALSFDAGDFLQGAYGATLAQPLTIYAVFEPTSLAAVQYVYDGDDGTNRVALLTTNTPLWGYLAATLRTGGTPTAAIHAAATVANGASSGLFIDDLRAGQAVITTSPGTAGIDGLTVGAANTGAQLWAGYIWEILVYSGAHDAATRKLIGDYLTARYTGLTVVT